MIRKLSEMKPTIRYLGLAKFDKYDFQMIKTCFTVTLSEVEMRLFNFK
jgi:hypothetical protein